MIPQVEINWTKKQIAKAMYMYSMTIGLGVTINSATEVYDTDN